MNKEVSNVKYYVIVHFGSFEGDGVYDFNTVEEANEYITNGADRGLPMRVIKGVELKIGVIERITEEA